MDSENSGFVSLQGDYDLHGDLLCLPTSYIFGLDKHLVLVFVVIWPPSFKI